MSEWMPIESAPKDGSEILAFARSDTSGKFYGVAQWAEKSDALPDSVAGWFWPFAIRPTHWMSLPPPPSSADKDKDA